MGTASAPPRLGTLLLSDYLVSQAELEEALEAQVVYGGRLGTNLVELGFVKEADLARVLGRQHHLPFASGEMVPEPGALAVAPAQFYDDHDVLPMRLDETRLTVAVISPGQLAAIDRLAFTTGKRVVQVVIPEFRMAQLLRKHARAFRPLRPIDMNTLRPTKAQQAGPPRPADVADLINEADFAAIYAQATLHDEEPPIVQGTALEEAAPGPVASPVPAAPAPPPREAPQPAPLTFAEAQRLLQQSQSRDDIAQTVLRFARGRFARALLLTVRGDLVTGWQGLGQGVTVQVVRRIGVSLAEDNSMRLVRDLRSHFIGPMKRTPGMDVFFALLGGAPATAVMMPLLVRGKPVHLLYVDHGPGRVTTPDLGELLIVSQGVSRSYDVLIRARQGATGG